MKMFPDNCSPKCPYFSCYDLSIDDLVYCCSKLGMKVDVGFNVFKTKCPIDKEDDTK
jgi:hypothetical protein